MDGYSESEDPHSDPHSDNSYTPYETDSEVEREIEACYQRYLKLNNLSSTSELSDSQSSILPPTIFERFYKVVISLFRFLSEYVF